MSARRVILVSGANRGIGNQIVRNLSKLVSNDDRVILTARLLEDAVVAANDINNEVGKGNVVALEINVESDESVNNASQFVKDNFGRLDVLINNAGYNDGTDPLSENEEKAKKTIGINYFGVIRIINSFISLLEEGSRILNISSGLGVININYSQSLRERFLSDDIEEHKRIYDEFIEYVKAGSTKENGYPAQFTSYKVSKGLLNSYGRYLEKNVLTPKKIFIATICPGHVKTRMGGELAQRSLDQGADTPVWMSLEPLSSLSTGLFWRDREVIAWSEDKDFPNLPMKLQTV